MARSKPQEKRLSPESAAALTRAVAGAEMAAVPLPEVLIALADDLADRRLAATARDLAETIRQGTPPDEAFAAVAKRLPDGTDGLLAVGAAKGACPDLFEKYSRLQIARKEIAQTIWSACAYPCAILVLFIPILLLITTWLAPMLGTIIDDSYGDLPAITASALRIAQEIPVILAVFFGVPAGLFLIIKIFRLRRLNHRLRNALPIVGRLWIWAGQLELASLLAVFLKNRFPLPDALDRTAALVHDQTLAQTCRWLRNQVESGNPLNVLCAKSLHIEPLLTDMVGYGVQYGILPEILDLATELYRARIMHRAAFLVRVLPVITLLTIGGFIAAFIFSTVLLPMFLIIQDFYKWW